MEGSYWRDFTVLCYYLSPKEGCGEQNGLPSSRDGAATYTPMGVVSVPPSVNLNTCQLFYDQIVDNKPSNFTIFFVSEQHNYATRSTSLQHLNPSSFRIDTRKFCPTIIGCCYWNDIPISICKKQSTVGPRFNEPL